MKPREPDIQSNVSLKLKNTLGLSCEAEYAAFPKDLGALLFALEFAKKENLPFKVLGEGSNVLLPPKIKGLILFLELPQTCLSYPLEGGVEIVGSASLPWKDLVQKIGTLGLYGAESLSGIPGTFGAAVYQNIGAYGLELSDLLGQVQFLDTHTLRFEKKVTSECGFAYRDSLFKQSKNRYLILQASLRLSLNPNLGTNFESMTHNDSQNTSSPTALQAKVLEVRDQKLPKSNEFFSVGSFFKNPILSEEAFSVLNSKVEHLPKFPAPDGNLKTSSAFLIEQAGFPKGYWNETLKAGLYQNHALVLGHKGESDYHSLITLARDIQQTVASKFQIKLEPEAEILNENLDQISL